MLVAQNSLGPVCPVPLTVRGRAGGDERLLKNLFAAELPDELFRKVITFWAPVWR